MLVQRILPEDLKKPALAPGPLIARGCLAPGPGALPWKQGALEAGRPALEAGLGALALEFQHTRSIWNGFHADNCLRLTGGGGKLAAALTLTPDTDGHLGELRSVSATR